MPRWSAVPLVVLLLALSGCRDGSSQGGPDAEPDAAAIRAGLAALFAGDHPGDKEVADGECFAAAFTDTVTPDQLQTAGVLDASYDVVPALSNLPKDVAQKWVDAQFECTDFVAESTSAQVKVSKGRIDAAGYAECLRGALTDAQLRAAVVDSLTGNWDGAGVNRLSRAQVDCSRAAQPNS